MTKAKRAGTVTITVKSLEEKIKALEKALSKKKHSADQALRIKALELGVACAVGGVTTAENVVARTHAFYEFLNGKDTDAASGSDVSPSIKELGEPK